MDEKKNIARTKRDMTYVLVQEFNLKNSLITNDDASQIYQEAIFYSRGEIRQSFRIMQLLEMRPWFTVNSQQKDPGSVPTTYGRCPRRDSWGKIHYRLF